MITIKSEQVLCCDVDFTLLMHGKIKKGDKVVQFTDPETGEQKYISVHVPNLKVVTNRLSRGAVIWLWSASGHAWATAAAKALGLHGKKNLVISSKPIAYIDDKPCQEFMGERIWLPVDSAWGR